MPLDFPSNPVNGQTYDNYFWDASTGVWRNNGSKNALSQRLTALEATPSGLAPIIPTSVGAVTSGTASVSATGVVTFSGTTGIQINGCFTQSYTNYRIIYLQESSNANSTDLFFRLRASGSDLSTASYFYNGVDETGTVVTGVGVTAQGQYFCGYTHGNAVGAHTSMTIDVQKPQQLKAKTFTSDAYGWTGAAGRKILMGGFNNSSSYQADGFTIWPAGGSTFGGTIQVYGYRN